MAGTSVNRCGHVAGAGQVERGDTHRLQPARMMLDRRVECVHVDMDDLAVRRCRDAVFRIGRDHARIVQGAASRVVAKSVDAQTGEYTNLISKGIIDPTKVVRVAVQNAASVAALLITTEAMVAELPKKPAAGPAVPPGGGMGGMNF
jgi:hypothetical protein